MFWKNIVILIVDMHSYDGFFLSQYSETCIKRPLEGERESGLLIQVVS